MTPHISIIIPTYNRKDKLKKAIESALIQTYKDFELLICDDGSTDGTQDMLSTFNDPRIRWIPGANSGGPATPRNRGIQASRAEWLAFLDSDDLWMPDKLEKQLKTAKVHQVRAVCANAKVLKDNIVSQVNYFQDLEDKFLTFEDMLKVNFVICSSMLIDKDIVKKVGKFPNIYDEDYALWLSASMLTDIYYMDEELLVYRDEPQESLRGRIQEKELTKYNKIIIECLKRTKNIGNKSKYIRKLVYAYMRKNIFFVIKKNIFFFRGLI